MDIIILLATCAINLLLGMLVLLRDRRRLYARMFALMSVLIGVWIVANYLTNHYTANLMTANIANKLAYASGFSVVVCGLIFSYSFPVRRRVPTKEIVLLAVPSLLIIILSFTDLIAGEVGVAEGVLTYSNPPFLWLYAIGFIGLIAVIARNLLTIPKKEGSIKRKQAHFVLIAFSSSALLGLFVNVILPLFAANWDVTRFGPLVTIILVGTIAYTIVKHGLFDIRLAVVRGMAYALSLLTLAGMYYLVAYAISQVFLRDQGATISQSPLSIFLALLLAFIFQPIKNFFDQLTNRIFYRSNYSIDDFIFRISRKLAASNDLKSLLEQAATDIADMLHVERAFFVVHYEKDRSISSGMPGYDHVKNEDIKKINAYFETTHTEMILPENMAEKGGVRKLLLDYKIRLVLPLWQADMLVGYLFLGDKLTGSYVQRDFKALRTVRDELIIAIQNAFSVQEVKDINATLQQRIQDATKELRASNAQLQRLDEAKDEFVSMASHQLRTPLTSVKGYISMVLEGDAGKITAMQRQLLGEAFTSSERMVHLINDFLNVSRLQTGKFMIEARAADLSKIVAQEVESLQTTAGAHDLRLRFRPPSRFPLLYLDEGKIRQVLMNFIDNAIYYSHEDTTITVELSVVDGFAVVEVHDTGIGVPASEQPHLFSKFFRATNARKQRPDGTGVGLFLAKKVVDAHGGGIIFRSVEGEGSTFGFRLPIKKLSSPSKQADELDD